MDDLGDAAKTADKLEDISDGTKLLPPPKELGDVYHVKSNAYAQSVLDEINPDYFNRNNRFADGFYIANKGETAIKEVVHHGGDVSFP